MKNRVCSVEGCERPHRAKGLCNTHYRRNKRTGTTDARLKDETIVRFWSHIDQSDGCWNWTSYITDGGYGRFFDGDKAVAAHRFYYQLQVCDIPDGLEIDHICHNRRCVRPDHLRAVTRKENQEHRVHSNSNSRSGVRGVHWHNAQSRWVATVGHHHRRITVGYFDTIDEAEAAVIAKRKELFTHNDADRVSA